MRGRGGRWNFSDPHQCLSSFYSALDSDPPYTQSWHPFVQAWWSVHYTSVLWGNTNPLCYGEGSEKPGVGGEWVPWGESFGMGWWFLVLPIPLTPLPTLQSLPINPRTEPQGSPSKESQCPSQEASWPLWHLPPFLGSTCTVCFYLFFFIFFHELC